MFITSRQTTTYSIAFLLIFTGWALTPLITPGGAEAASTTTALNKASETSVSSADLTAFEQAFVTAAERIQPSVVSITSTRDVKTNSFSQVQPFPFDDFFGRDWFQYFQRSPQSRSFRQVGLGSGVIVNTRGYILTNNHVIDGASRLMVQLHDGREHPAEIVGSDTKTDLAVIKIDADNLQAASLGDSSTMRVGQWVLAVGSPFGLSQTVTSGIISATGREGVGVAQYEDFLQTDAPINQGNSGGPLINLRGQVVGINTAIMSRGGGNDGIGMAIPIRMAQTIMEKLIADGKVTRGWLGLSIQNLTDGLADSFGYDDNKGVLVAGVQEESPADKAGFRDGDIILKMDGDRMTSASELRHRVAQENPGTKVRFQVWRDHQRKTLQVTLGELPDDIGRGGSYRQSGTFQELGLELRDPDPAALRHFRLPADAQGAVIANVRPGSVADAAGLQPGDLIVQANGKNVRSAAQASKAIRSAKDAGVRLRVRSGEAHRFVYLQTAS